MLFNSFHFLVFFGVVVGLYFALPDRWRVPLLLLASGYFYMVAIPVYILILILLIAIDYTAGLWIDRAVGFRRKLLLVVSLVANVGVLGFFKYWNFFATNLGAGSEWLHQFVLPIGLSFHTFQSMAYTIEVYSGTIRPEPNLLRYSLYVLFFPQLVAGPIERPNWMLPQFRLSHRFDSERIVQGLRQILWGMFKKVVIADRLAILVDLVYDTPQGQPGPALFLATLFFAFQIYCDFSGYSDIALGTARVLGYRMMLNFRKPYLATSVSDFWRRWHISLSTWFRDYVYIPLGGSRCGLGRQLGNLLITFLISGLWHGANWTFVVWGALHGAYLMGEILLNRFLTWLPRLLRRAYVLALVLAAWVFFRADTVQDAWFVLTHLGTGWAGWTVWMEQMAVRVTEIVPFEGVDYFWLSFSLIGGLMALEAASGDRPVDEWIGSLRPAIRTAVELALMVGILNLGVAREVPFVYFQF
ncbi:MAG: MBOAT family O-acyltransferase [Candidatus Eremiobacterota bacterium]